MHDNLIQRVSLHPTEDKPTCVSHFVPVESEQSVVSLGKLPAHSFRYSLREPHELEVVQHLVIQVQRVASPKTNSFIASESKSNSFRTSDQETTSGFSFFQIVTQKNPKKYIVLR